MKQWIKIDRFAGYETKVDPSKVNDGAVVAGHNTTSNERDRISIRQEGFELFANVDFVEPSDKFNSTHTFRKRDGKNIIMGAIKDKLVYLNNGKFEILRDENELDAPFAFVDYNINTDVRSQVYFGNGYQNLSRWNGAIALVESNTETTITKQGDSSFADEGFLNEAKSIGSTDTSFDITKNENTIRYTYKSGTNPNINDTLCPIGTHIFIYAQNFDNRNCGRFKITNLGENYFEIENELGIAESGKTIGNGFISMDYDYPPYYIMVKGKKYRYKGGAYGTTLTGLEELPELDECSVAQAVEEFPNAPKGNIMLTASNRIFISPLITPQAVYFSEYGNPTNFVGATLVLNSTATSPGIFNFGEGGGAVTGGIFDEGSVYWFKKNLIYKTTLSDSLYVILPLKPFDGKSQTIGCVTRNSAFSGGNGIFFFTPDNQILYLSRLEQLDYPQASSISEPIQDVVGKYSFKNARGIVFGERAYFSVGSTKEAVVNDVVLVYNISEKTWDTPYLGWSVGDFLIYNEELYLVSSTSPDIYKVIDKPIDGEYDTTAEYHTKLYDFGLPQQQKQITNLFLEGYIAQNTELEVQLLLDECGFTQSFSTFIDGAKDTDLFYSTFAYNTLGTGELGLLPFASNEAQTGLRKFRVYLGKDFQASPFYNLQLVFKSSGQNQQWRITNYSFEIKPYSQENKRKLFKSFQITPVIPPKKIGILATEEEQPIVTNENKPIIVK